MAISATSFLIRVQALGGKCLGPDIGYSLITVRDAVTGEVLDEGLASGDSGQLTPGSTEPPAGATVSTIITGSSFQWLSPTAGTPSPTAGYLATIQISQPTLDEVTAASLTNGVPNQHSTSARLWVVPGADLTVEPGLVLVMPGLDVAILSPGIVAPAQNPLTVAAWVTMMCGCKIADDSAWPSGEFVVTATVLDFEDTLVAQETLTWSSTPSIFTTAATPIVIPARQGNFRLVVTAVQASTSNSGSASMFFSL